MERSSTADRKQDQQDFPMSQRGVRGKDGARGRSGRLATSARLWEGAAQGRDNANSLYTFHFKCLLITHVES